MLDNAFAFDIPLNSTSFNLRATITLIQHTAFSLRWSLVSQDVFQDKNFQLSILS